MPLNVRLPRDLHTRLKTLVARRGTNIRAYVVQVIAEAVERDERADEARRGGPR